MDPRQLFFDERLKGGCAYCGAPPRTRDHVPSRVLLDKPYPQDLPVVGACAKCNNGFSPHERAAACLVDCAAWGSITAPQLRPKVKQILFGDPQLSARVEMALRAGASTLSEDESVIQIVAKLAKGHLAFMEYPTSDPPSTVRVVVRPDLSAAALRRFDDLPAPELFPEIGTRAFMGVLLELSGSSPMGAGWSVVQEGRYRYAVLLGGGPTVVRFVLSEYLFCEVSW